MVDFIGGDAEAILEAGAIPCVSLEDAARKAVAALRGEEIADFEGFDATEEDIEAIVEKAVASLKPDQKTCAVSIPAAR